MAEIGKDQKNDAIDADAEALEQESETRAQRSLKSLIRDAGTALDGLLDDAPATAEVAEAIAWEMEGAEFAEEVVPSVEQIEEEAQISQEELSEEDAALADAELGPAEFIENERVISIIEALLFASDRPVSLNTIKQIFKGSNVRTKDISRCLDLLASEYARTERGVTLEEVNGGYQLRTKVDNAEFLKRLSKTRPFRLSGPALETLAIVAYKQPLTKHEVDEIRGVESGHLVRALMERGLVCFNGKSELPGKPMLYGTTRKFLETFGLRNLKELPTLAEIDELLPEGIGDEVEEKKPKLADLTDGLAGGGLKTQSYSEGEEELQKINDSLSAIDTSSEFFEQEKIRQREKRDTERAANIREAMAVGEDVEAKDKKWLARYEAKLAMADSPEAVAGDEFRKDIEGLTENLGMDASDAEDTTDAAWDDLGEASEDISDDIDDGTRG